MMPARLTARAATRWKNTSLSAFYRCDDLQISTASLLRTRQQAAGVVPGSILRSCRRRTITCRTPAHLRAQGNRRTPRVPREGIHLHAGTPRVALWKVTTTLRGATSHHLFCLHTDGLYRAAISIPPHAPPPHHHRGASGYTLFCHSPALRRLSSTLAVGLPATRDTSCLAVISMIPHALEEESCLHRCRGLSRLYRVLPHAHTAGAPLTRPPRSCLHFIPRHFAHGPSRCHCPLYSPLLVPR